MTAAPHLPGPPRAATRIDVVYFNAGGGHVATARALQAVMAAQRRPWQVNLVDLTAVLDPQERFRRLTRMAPEDLYNLRLARGWTLGLAHELKVLQRLIRWGHAALVRRLQRHWRHSAPDLVVSVVPNFNRALCESLAAALPGVPYVTVLTDLADHPPHFWIEPGLPQHLVCGTDRAVAQARAAGVPDERIHATTGMVLRPAFHRAAPPCAADVWDVGDGADLAAARRAAGLDPHRPTGLVLFGGQGSRVMVSIAEQLADTQLILMCGHNAALAEHLRALPARSPRLVVGFTQDVPHHMRLADFLIGKPGPGSVSEALRMGLPVIVACNAWTMPQERYNARWIAEQQVGLVVPGYRALAPAVAEMTRRLADLRARVRRIDNRAVFEVPEILADLLVTQAPRPVPPAAGLPAAVPARRPAAAALRHGSVMP